MPVQVAADSIRKQQTARKQSFKPVLSSGSDVDWPTIPQHARQQFLAATIELLQGVQEYKHAHTGRLRKKRKLSTEELPASQNTVTLRNGKQVTIARHVEYCTTYKPEDAVEPPEVLKHLVIGINSVQAWLEAYIAQARGTPKPLTASPEPFVQPVKPVKSNPQAVDYGPLLRKASSLASYKYLQTIAKKGIVAPQQSILDEGTDFDSLATTSEFYPALFGPVTRVKRKSGIKRNQFRNKYAANPLRHSLFLPMQKLFQAVGGKSYFRIFDANGRVRKKLLRSKFADGAVSDPVLVTSRKRKAVDEQPAATTPDSPIRYLLVCRPDINPPQLIAHIPRTVCVANGLMEAEQGIFLIQLDKGAEQLLASALGIRKAAVIGIKAAASGADKLEQLAKHHLKEPLRVAHLCPPSATFQPEHTATHIKQLATTLPADARALRQERKAARKDRKGQHELSRAHKV